MRGSAHLAIGLITGVAIAGLVPGIPFSLPGIALAGFSALAPDLDHPESRLSKRLGFLHAYVRWAFGAAALALACYAYFQLRPGPDQRLTYIAALAFGLLGVALQGGHARKLALLFTGMATVLAGLYAKFLWLSLLGGYISLAPYTSHRTWTHTIWAAIFWTYVGELANRSLGWHGVAYYAGGGYVSHLLADTLTKSGVQWLRPLTNFSFKIPLLSTGSKAGNVMEATICLGYGLLVLGLVIGRVGF
ncbi:metal-dependent hydrolase [Hymenobacter sp. H14-R3]|uniref:metal-dependent hydrolase n=1 Tax=Hymenobacter sp. H14-R3 TaxID=3046308 RepID=UPI0024B8ABE4|nr:metal-dependent hydrolase [Hymenobacter sp. H14-R3]MDJ0367623.1 metal-dependent hydrolase [Hymenobacter sp. H14-R3]